MGILGSPACQLSLQVLGLVSLYNHRSQFLIINLSLHLHLYLYIILVLFFWRTRIYSFLIWSTKQSCEVRGSGTVTWKVNMSACRFTRTRTHTYATHFTRTLGHRSESRSAHAFSVLHPQGIHLAAMDGKAGSLRVILSPDLWHQVLFYSERSAAEY